MRKDTYMNIDDAELKQIDSCFQVYNVILDDRHCIFKYNANMDKLNTIEDYHNLTINDYIDREILVSYLARMVGISCVTPVRAEYKGHYGILEEDYNQKGYIAYSGYEILEEYLNYLDRNHNAFVRPTDNKTAYIAEHMNNLDMIYKALDYFFRNDPDKDEYLDELFSEFVKRFAFDYITMQKDRGPGNWAVLVGQGKEPKLSMMYDNEEALIEHGDYQMKVKSMSETKVGIITSLYNNLHEDYINIFKNLVNELNEEKFLYALSRMELERGELPKKAKEQIIKSFHKHYQETKSLLCQKKKNMC